MKMGKFLCVVYVVHLGKSTLHIHHRSNEKQSLMYAVNCKILLNIPI